MKFLRRYWYNIGLFVAIAAGVYLFFAWQGMVVLQKILLFNFIALLLHQFEEYGWPGGAPWIFNQVVNPDGIADRFPVNQNNGLVINVFAAYPFYLLPVFFPNIVWLALAPILFGFGQFFFHGIMVNKKIKSLYNPGLGAVILGHIPLGIWYIYEAYSQNLITVWDWVFGIVYLGVFIGLIMKKIGYGLLQDRNSPYPFAEKEMKRFNIAEKMRKKGISIWEKQD